MAKLTIHGEPETIDELKDELPRGTSWDEYILECVEIRKRVEGGKLKLYPTKDA